MLLIRFALPSVRIAVLFAFRSTYIASEKSHGKPCAYRGKCKDKRALGDL